MSPIAEHLSKFEIEYKQVLETDSKIISSITDHLAKGSGKRLRPALVFLASGNINETTLYSALAVELIHNATLMHDDVVDGSDTRRGIKTINYKWSNLVSVLMGDYLFAKAFGLLVKTKSAEILKTFSNATERVSVGELNQVFYTGDFSISEESYLNVIADKTASLFACSAESGALSSEKNLKAADNLKKYGELIGMAFQITDDLLDLIGETKKTGKTLGSDIREGWITLPLIHAIKNGNGKEKKWLEQIFGNDINDSDITEVANFAMNYGGIEYAELKAKQYVENAIEIINKLDGLPTKSSLIELAYVAAKRDM